MDADQARKVLEAAVSYAHTDDVVATLTGETTAATRYANNEITQNQTVTHHRLSVTAAIGQKVGTTSTGVLNRRAIRQAVRQAEEMARGAHPDLEHLPALGAQTYTPSCCWSVRTARSTPAQRARAVRCVCRRATRDRLTAAGVFTTETGWHTVLTSNGLFAYGEWSDARFSCTAIGPTGSGWAEQMNYDVEQLDPPAVAERACRKALSAADPRELEPGYYTVILEPAALAEMLLMILSGLDAKAVDQGRSYLSRKKTGDAVAGANVTCWSDHAHERVPGLPFQHEGLANRRITWIDCGVLANLYYTRFWAQRSGTEPTGLPPNVIMTGGEQGIDDMVRASDRAILVTRFWYIRDVDPMVPLVTGMTRDGTYLVERGEIRYPIKNLRFNDNPLRVLGQIDMLSPVVRTGEYIPMALPAVRAHQFHFTSGTTF